MLSDERVAIVGCDVQAVDEVAQTIAQFGDRYLDRVYTATEQAESPHAASLAARFAAKEAVLKLIGAADGIDPRSVEVLRGPVGRPQIQLHAAAARAQVQAGVTGIDISLSHTAGLAFAVAAATRTTPAPAATTPAATTPAPAETPPGQHHDQPRRQVNHVTGTTSAAEVRSILAEHGRLSADVATLSDTDDLYAAGLTSHAAVTVMLALEDAFDTEFTEALLTKATFASVTTITAALATLGAGAADSQDGGSR